VIDKLSISPQITITLLTALRSRHFPPNSSSIK